MSNGGTVQELGALWSVNNVYSKCSNTITIYFFIVYNANL